MRNLFEIPLRIIIVPVHFTTVILDTFASAFSGWPPLADREISQGIKDVNGFWVHLAAAALPAVGCRCV